MKEPANNREHALAFLQNLLVESEQPRFVDRIMALSPEEIALALLTIQNLKQLIGHVEQALLMMMVEDDRIIAAVERIVLEQEAQVK